MRISRISRLAAIALLGGLVLGAGATKANAQDDNKWVLKKPTFFFWMAGLDGDIEVEGTKVDFSADFADIMDNVDNAFMTYLEWRNKDNGFYIQPNYMKFDERNRNFNGGTNTAELDSSFTMVEVGYMINMVRPDDENPNSTDAVIGARWWNLDLDLDIYDEFGTQITSGSKSGDILDAFVGVRFQGPMGNGSEYFVQLDIGGFGLMDDSTDLTWQAIGAYNQKFTRDFSAFIGYRAVGIEQNFDSDHGIEAVMHGLLLGFDLKF